MKAKLQPVTSGPHFTSADVRERLESDNFQAVWLENIVSPEGDFVTEYEFIIIVFPKDDPEPEPVLFVTSEKNAVYTGQDKAADASGQGDSHFFCEFDAKAHYNFGASNSWADPIIFRLEAAVRILERTGELMRREEADEDEEDFGASE